MNKQPMPLFLADVIETDPNSKAQHIKAADELRRLHAEVEALKLDNNNLRWLSMRMTPGKAEEVKP